ncbi:MAG: AraC family transcriptional regulator [Actinomycetota bacterium]|nr:AraC family transcriptional regulator [Actinomycetota bacterium]
MLPGIAGVRKQILVAVDSAEALDLLESFMESHARADWSIPSSLERAVDLIAADPQQRIGAVAAALGITHKTLIGQFHRYCGCTPKVFADVYRHLAFLERMRTAPKDLTWVELVSETNYYDQAHFIRVFTRFTGMTPSDYLRYRAETGDDDPSFIALGNHG